VLVLNVQGLHRTTVTQFLMQDDLNLVDWNNLDLLSTEKRCKASVKIFERSPTVWAEWIELKETLAKFQADRGKETRDDKGSDDMTSKAECKRKSDASLMEFSRRSGMGFSRQLSKDYAARGCRCRRCKRGLGNSRTPLCKQANLQRRTSTTCCFSSLMTFIQYGTRTPFWIELKNW